MRLSKSEFISSIEGMLPDNSTQEISPLDLRTSLINLADSVPNFMEGATLNTKNFATRQTRTTLAGDFALDDFNRGVYGRVSSDNTAVGYATLRQSLNGSGNTAVGSFSQSCLLTGNSNTSVGLQSSSSNVSGSGNTAVGTFALNNNRRGSFNVAIGHGAGWYIGPEQDYTLSIGSLPITSGDLCVDNELVYEGNSPLIYGDLTPNNQRLAIGTTYLHNFGMLQVSGDASPSISGQFSLGRSNFSWANINEEIYFSGSVIGIGGIPSGAPQGITGNNGSQDARMTVYGDLVPSESGRFALGHPSLTWDGYFNDVVISGQAFINNAIYQNIEQCLYECKTLHLATSGFCDPEDNGFHDSSVCGILTDEQLDGAGLEVHSSGASNSYRRDYRLIYKAPDPSLTCLPSDNAFSRSRWESNISFEVVNGPAFIGDRFLSRDKGSFITQSGCFGLFLDPGTLSGQRAFITQKEHYESHLEASYSGISDANFIARSGTKIIEGSPSGYNYNVTYGSIDSGVKIMQSFLTRIGNGGTAKGFRLIYHDERDTNGEIDCGLLGYKDLNVNQVIVTPTA